MMFLLNKKCVKEVVDVRMVRARLFQARGCEGHLGHLFDDGPDPAVSYCMNSASLLFKEVKNNLLII
jgi:peptide methionine sulfoxide reductase MsrB